MTVLYEIRDKLREFYAQFSGVLNICGKFLLAVFVFLFINRKIGFNPFVSNVFVILILSLLSSIMSAKVLLILSSLAILLNTYSIGLEAFGVTALVILLLLFLFVWFIPDEAIYTVLMPLSLAIGLPAFIPIVGGLRRRPSVVAAIVPGIVMHYYLDILAERATMLQGGERSEIVNRIKLIFDSLLAQQVILVEIVAAIAVVLLVFAIRKMSADYAHEIAVAVGCLAYIVVSLVLNMTFSIGASVQEIVVSGVLSAVAAFVFLFLIFRVDYSRTEQLTFEDDDYYYYVKAMPKIRVQGRERVTRTLTEKDGKATSTGTLGEVLPDGAQKTDEPLPAAVAKPQETGGKTIDFGERLEESLKNL